MGFQKELRAALEDLNSGNFRRADKTLSKISRSAPSHPDPHVLMSLSAYRSGRLKSSEHHLRRAVALAPDRTDIRLKFGELLLELGRPDDALDQLDAVLRAHPDDRTALRLSARARSVSGRFAAAAEHLERLLTVSTDDEASIHYELGLAQTRLGNDREAESRFATAAQLDPGNVQALSQHGSSLIRLGDLAKAESVLEQAARTASDPTRPGAVELSPLVLRHEVEQIDHLQRKGLATRSDLDYRDKVSALLRHPEDKSAVDSGFIETYAMIDHRGFGKVPDGDFLNPDIDPDRVQAEYFAGTRSCIALDDVLAPAALAALRDFCLGARIWKKPYVAGYLGAGLGEGFGCELVLRLSETLRTAFPRIFGEHRLRQAWGFKYENSGKGVNVHADIGVVNVNFWITPDVANRDPDGGGLTVYDAPAPRDWNFADYNTDTRKIRRYLKDNDAKAIRIPHRGNRAAIFDSTLFHETHDIDFRPGYENRRINVTFVYGRGMPK